MRLWVFIFALLMTSVSFGYEGNLKDRWPWSWGMECPMPWSAFEGGWVIDARTKHKEFDGQQIWIETVVSGRSPVRTVTVEQYNRRGHLIAKGTTYIEKDDIRVLDLYLRNPRTNRITSKIILRTYIYSVEPRPGTAPSESQCYGRRKAFAATFCPIRGTRCKEDANYLMERIQ